MEDLREEAVGSAGAGLLAELASLGVEGIVREYEEVRTETAAPPGLSTAIYKKNKDRNRYPDVGCWDETRVALTEPVGTDDGDASDYIHASFVQGGRWPREFIATQGPMESTLEEFWHMVWEQRVSVIVMLCLCVENGRRKCEQYWNLQRGESIELETGYVVKTVERETIRLGAHILVSTRLHIRKGDTRPRELLHIVHTNWPDKGLPPQPAALPLASLVRKLHAAQDAVAVANGFQPKECPVLVHCSAGIGRTGTLIAFAIAVATLASGRPLRLRQLVASLRRQRKQAVQNAHQYVFLYLVLAELILHFAPGVAPNSPLDLGPLRNFAHTHPIL